MKAKQWRHEETEREAGVIQERSKVSLGGLFQPPQDF